MSKALITKLNGVVDNDSLYRLGELPFIVPANATKEGTTVELLLTGNNTFRIKNTGVYNYDNSVVATKGQTSFTEERYSNATYRLESDSAGGIFVVPNKYSIQELTTNLKIDIDDNFRWFKGTILSAPVSMNKNAVENISGEMTKLFVSYEGDLSAFSRFTSLTTLGFREDKLITGDFSSLGALTKLTNLYLNNTSSLNLKIEDFVKAQRNAGRTSCDNFSLACGGTCGVTFNGKLISEWSTKLSWTDTQITCKNTTIQG